MKFEWDFNIIVSKLKNILKFSVFDFKKDIFSITNDKNFKNEIFFNYSESIFFILSNTYNINSKNPLKIWSFYC